MISQLSSFQGGRDTDCSVNERMAKLAAAGATGAIGGPFGFLFGLSFGLAYDAWSCGWK